MSVGLISQLLSAVSGASVGGLAHTLAVVGLVMIASVALGYAIVGGVKLIKKISSMKVKEFSLLILAIGFVLLGIAVALP